MGGKAAAAEEEEERMLRLAPIKAGGGRQRVFLLTPGTSGDRRLCTRARPRVVVGLIRQRFLGMR